MWAPESVTDPRKTLCYWPNELTSPTNMYSGTKPCARASLVQRRCTKTKVGHWADNKPPPSTKPPWVHDSVRDSVLEFGAGVGAGVDAPLQKC